MTKKNNTYKVKALGYTDSQETEFEVEAASEADARKLAEKVAGERLAGMNLKFDPKDLELEKVDHAKDQEEEEEQEDKPSKSKKKN